MMTRAKLAGAALLTATATVALGLPSVDGIAAAVPAAAPSWPAHLARPVPASCPRGETKIAPTGGWTDALGVSHVTYQADPGLVTLVPPRGLTAGGVTAALTADVGLRGGGSASPAVHQALVRKVLNLARNQRAPEFCRSQPGRGTLAKRTSADSSRLRNTVILAPIWGGYATTQSEHGSPINGASGVWTVPRHTPGLSPSAESTWVGIGGNIGGETGGIGLIQTGTSMQTSYGFRSWYEWIGSTGCTGFCGKYSSVNAISPGDKIFAQVTWNSSTKACFILDDFSRSTGSWDACPTVNIPYDHTSAEWVNENHIPDGYYYDNPHTVSWTAMYLTNALGGNGGWVSPFSSPYAAIIMGTGKTPPAGTVSCSNPNFLSYPVGAANTSTGGSSKILTCYRSGYDSP